MFALKDLVSNGKVARFTCLMAESLWYETEDGFAFPVPLSETAGATFLAEEKALLYMRHIRRQLPNANGLVAGLARLVAQRGDGPVVRFMRFTCNEMWFAGDDGFEFPVVVSASDSVAAVEPASRFADAARAYRAMIDEARAESLQASAQAPALAN